MKPGKLTLELASLSQLSELQQLFIDTIAGVCKKDYNEDQILVWSSSVENKQRWIDIVTKQYVLVAFDKNKILGFGSLDVEGFIDMLYVHKDFQGQGIASKLYDHLENKAVRQGKTFLLSDVSKTARSFFEKKGFRVVAEQILTIQGIELSNFRMHKNL